MSKENKKEIIRNLRETVSEYYKENRELTKKNDKLIEENNALKMEYERLKELNTYIADEIDAVKVVRMIIDKDTELGRCRGELKSYIDLCDRIAERSRILSKKLDKIIEI